MTVCLDTNALVQLFAFADCDIAASANFLLTKAPGTCGLPLRDPLSYDSAMNGNVSDMALELDATTIRVVEHLAQTWGVSKQEAVRRAVEQADAAASPPEKQDRLAAFKALQRRLHLTPAKAAEWQTAVRDARR